MTMTHEERVKVYMYDAREDTIGWFVLAVMFVCVMLMCALYVTCKLSWSVIKFTLFAYYLLLLTCIKWCVKMYLRKNLVR